MRTAAFVLPDMASRADDLRVAASALGSAAEFLSEPITAAPGQTIDFSVVDALGGSTVHVRDRPAPDR